MLRSAAILLALMVAPLPAAFAAEQVKPVAQSTGEKVDPVGATGSAKSVADCAQAAASPKKEEKPLPGTAGGTAPCRTQQTQTTLQQTSAKSKPPAKSTAPTASDAEKLFQQSLAEARDPALTERQAVQQRRDLAELDRLGRKWNGGSPTVVNDILEQGAIAAPASRRSSPGGYGASAYTAPPQQQASSAPISGTTARPTTMASAAPASKDTVRLEASSSKAKVALTVPTAALANGTRIALIIGNSRYGGALGLLPNPVNDADDMGIVLRGLGFEVEVAKNVDQKSMKRAIARFGERLRAAGPTATGLFFYAGHGIQSKGTNYLVPVGATISVEADVDLESVAADTVLLQMEEAGSATNIVILDACRNMPLARSFRSGSGGLAPMDAPNGSFIAYSTSPGATAADGAGRNSPFVTALLANINRKGEPIEAVFRDVRRTVVANSAGGQRPWDASSLLQPFYFAAP